MYLVSGYVASSPGSGQRFGSVEAWRYDVGDDAYVALPDLPVERSAGQLEHLDGQLHYFGGTNLARTEDTAEHYVLDLADLAAGWTEAAPLPNARHHLGAAVLDGLIYAVGGQHGHDAALVTQDDVHAYDPASDSWTQVADLPAALGHISSQTFVLDGRIVVAGGELAHGGPYSAEVHAYDPLSDTWSTSSTPLPQSRSSAVGGPVGDGFVLSGGNGRASGVRATPTAG